jgi:hypothetical protein
VLHKTRIHVIRSVTIALVIISMRINALVKVSGHRQDMGSAVPISDQLLHKHTDMHKFCFVHGHRHIFI